MTTVDQLPEILQQLFIEDANRLARETQFIEREREWTGASFAQTLVFGWMEEPTSSLSQLQQMAQVCGSSVSAKTVATRLQEVEATTFLERLLERGLTLSTTISQTRTPSTLACPFEQIVLLDSTQITLPEGLAEVWSGGGNQHQLRAGMKIQTFYEWREGQLSFSLHPAVTNDRKLPLMPLLKGALVVHDSGFLSVARCRRLEQAEQYWLARVSAQMGVVSQMGQHLLLADYLQQAAGEEALFDQWVELTHQRHPVRLLAFRLPEPVVAMRREKLLQDSLRRTGCAPGASSLALCTWCVLATNASDDLLTPDQALCFYRARWQIELLFKLWKEHGALDTWRTENSQRIQTEVYAKLLMLLVQHWLLVETCWHFLDRSLVKALRWLRRHISLLVDRLDQPQALRTLLNDIAKGMTHCRLSKRQRRPAFFQLFIASLDVS